jgi:hypothetical protein
MGIADQLNFDGQCDKLHLAFGSKDDGATEDAQRQTGPVGKRHAVRFAVGIKRCGGCGMRFVKGNNGDGKITNNIGDALRGAVALNRFFRISE